MARDADVVVVGAGLAGLAAARQLTERGLWSVVLERDREPGGRVCSSQWEGCTIELGATFLTPGYRRVRRLLDECGLSDRLRSIENQFRTVVWRDGRAHSLDYRWPELELIRYRGIGVREKAGLLGILPAQLRAATSLRFFDLASAAPVDSRTLGQAVGENANRYFTSTIAELFCGWPNDEVSVAFGVLGARFPTRRMWILEDGMGTLPRELARSLDVRCGTAVERLRSEGGNVVAETSGGAIRAGAAILATRAHEAAELWPEVPDDLDGFLRTQEYSRGFGVLLRTSNPVRRFDDRGRELMMDVWPGDAGDRSLRAAIYMDERASDGGLIALAPKPRASSTDLDDDELAARLEAELRELLPELELRITARRALRWPIFVPSYPVGRARALAEFRSRLAPGPVQLAGDYLYGPMMEAAVRSGQDAAGRAIRFLRSSTPRLATRATT